MEKGKMSVETKLMYYYHEHKLDVVLGELLLCHCNVVNSCVILGINPSYAEMTKMLLKQMTDK